MGSAHLTEHRCPTTSEIEKSKHKTLDIQQDQELQVRVESHQGDTHCHQIYEEGGNAVPELTVNLYYFSPSCFQSLMPYAQNQPNNRRPRSPNGVEMLYASPIHSVVQTPTLRTGDGAMEEIRRSRRVRYEEDGGVRLAGGEVGQDGVDDDDEHTETGTTVTLPPPYSSVPRTR